MNKRFFMALLLLTFTINHVYCQGKQLMTLELNVNRALTVNGKSTDITQRITVDLRITQDQTSKDRDLILDQFEVDVVNHENGKLQKFDSKSLSRLLNSSRVKIRRDGGEVDLLEVKYDKKLYPSFDMERFDSPSVPPLLNYLPTMLSFLVFNFPEEGEHIFQVEHRKRNLKGRDFKVKMLPSTYVETSKFDGSDKKNRLFKSMLSLSGEGKLKESFCIISASVSSPDADSLFFRKQNMEILRVLDTDNLTETEKISFNLTEKP
jgi:hypothetical protein